MFAGFFLLFCECVRVCVSVGVCECVCVGFSVCLCDMCMCVRIREKCLFCCDDCIAEYDESVRDLFGRPGVISNALSYYRCVHFVHLVESLILLQTKHWLGASTSHMPADSDTVLALCDRGLFASQTIADAPLSCSTFAFFDDIVLLRALLFPL